MKRNIAVYVATLLATCVLCGCSGVNLTEAQRENADKIYFQDTVWGMTEKKLIELKGEPSTRVTDGLLSYNLDYGNLEAVAFYTFVEDELCMVHHSAIGALSLNDVQFIEAYHSIKDDLTELYGQPISDEMVWSDEQYKEDEASYIKAIEEGHLEYVAIWQKGDTYVSAYLSGEDSEIYGISIRYQDTSIFGEPPTVE